MDKLDLAGKTILVVDDEADLREIVASELEYMGAIVTQAENVPMAKMILQTKYVDLIISDIRMPGGTGIDLLSFIKDKNIKFPPTILITGFADVTIEHALNLGAEALLNKPFKLEELFQVAIKLTSDEKERYLNPTGNGTKELKFIFDESLNQKMNNHEIALGRGGMAITVKAVSLKWDIGDVLKFSFKFKDQEFSGSAICRWWKSNEQTHKVTLGLEFLQLSEKTLEYFHVYWEQNQIISFIPSLG